MKYLIAIVVLLAVAACGESEPTPIPTATPQPTVVPEPTATAVPTATPEPKLSLDPGMYQVGQEIQPGIYAGRVGTDLLDSCYWERLSGASGAFEEVLANDNSIGQFYVEILPADKFFKVDCEITPLEHWPAPPAPLSEVGPGTYIIGRDIAPGTYRGKGGSDVMSACYWERLAGLTDDMDDVLANDNATGAFFVTVEASDYALNTACDLTLSE